ncbi:MAG: MFS transporter [Spirochaetes bacterium]|nr:MFS transporter [Spirochaetota bacterium]
MVSYRLLTKNARTCIAVEPLWALFGPMASYFMPLYQKQLGLNEVQMGLLNSIGIATGLFFYSLAAPITDKLGRRRTSLIFDILSWTISMVIWALARSYIWFLAAAVFNSIVRVVYVSWNLLISEDANDEQRSTIFGWINIIGTFGGFTTLVGGMFITRFGVVPSMRILFLAGALSMTSMFFLRYLGTRETAMGKILMDKTKEISLLALTLRQLPRARMALKDPFFLRMVGIFFIVNAISVIDFFRILYLRDMKLLPPLIVSSVPALSALASFFLFFFILPRQKEAKAPNHLAGSFLACLAFQVFFIAMPKGSILAAILIFPSLQASYALLATFRDTVFMNRTEAEIRSERFSLIQSIMMLLCIPIGWIAGLLYSLSPHLPFVLSCLLYTSGFFLARKIRSMNAGT